MSYFKREREITREIAGHIEEIYNRKDAMICTSEEKSVGQGIFDYAIFDVDKEKFLKRVRSGLRIPITSESMVSVLLHLKNERARTLDYLQKVTGISRKHLKEKVLRFLTRKKYVIRNKNGNFLKNSSYENFIKFCIAIEAKLKEWKAALGQAYRYKEFADMTYVALSSKYIKNATKNITKFRKTNIGLIEVRKNNGLRIIFKPKKEKLRSKISRELCNEIIIKKYYRLFLRSNSSKAFPQASR